MKKIFYSWQSDTNSKYNRNFIKSCAEGALKKINLEYTLDESIRLDQDTKDVPGIPDIAQTIFEKIDESDIFLADITFIGKTSENKMIPNPNVMIELGYAIHSLGSKHIINVINDVYGTSEDGLPFDLAHKRWPIAFKYDENTIEEEKKLQKNNLVESLYQAVKVIIEHQKKSPKTLAALQKNPSVENIEKVIIESDPKEDWNFNNNDLVSSAIFKSNVNLNLKIDYNADVLNEDFKEKWANNNPDPKATSYACRLLYQQTEIKRYTLVSVDGGRALLPLPKYQTMEVKELEYKIAEIFDSTGTLSRYIYSSGIKLSS